MINQKTNDVIGLGNALMDFLIEIDEEKFAEFNLKKGEFHLVDEKKAHSILDQIKKHQLPVEIVPGGSVANTLRALAMLGSNVILCGKVGNDELGEMYIEKIKNHGVNSRIATHPCSTGQAVGFITPDSERTFSVYLGAAIELAPQDVLEEDIKKSKVLHLESYQLEGKTKEAVMLALRYAKKHNTLVSIDLSDPGVIRRNKELMKEIVENYVDIVFANEKEAEEFTGKKEEEAAKELSKSCDVAIVKIGARGSLIYHNSKLNHINSVPAKAIDTTGAGDSYAAGFLYGYCQGWDVKKSGELGSLLSSKIVERKGVKFDRQEMAELKRKVG